MNAKRTPDQRFLDAQIALLMDTPDGELDEMLQAAGFDPKDLVARGTGAVERALVAFEQAKQTSDALSSLPVVGQRDVAKRLGIRRSVFSALVERRARVETIPEPFLQRLAAEVGGTLESMRLALSEPVRFAAAQHKSDQAPELPKQVTFEQLLRDSSMTDAEIGELMREDT